MDIKDYIFFALIIAIVAVLLSSVSDFYKDLENSRNHNRHMYELQAVTDSTAKAIILYNYADSLDCKYCKREAINIQP